MSTQPGHNEQNHGNVGSKEAGGIELVETRETLDENQHETQNERVVCLVRHPGGLEWQVFSGHVVELQSLHESDVGEGDVNPGNQTGNGSDVQQPVEDSGTTVGKNEVTQSTENSSRKNGNVWNTTLGGNKEELWSSAGLSQTVQDSGTRVDVGVGGRDDSHQDDCVENTWQNWSTRVSDSNDERRRGGDVLQGLQSWIVERNQQTHEEDGENVENNDSPDDLLDGSRNSLSWVGGLTTGDTDQLDTGESEQGGDQRRQPGQESLGRHGRNDAFPGSLAVDGTITPSTWVSPVSEANRATGTGTTDHAQSVDDPAHDGKNLNTSDPELNFTVETNREHVGAGDENPENGDPGSQRNGGGPVLNNLAHNGHLKRESDGPREPVVPTVGNTQGWRTEARSELGERTGNRNVGGHLTQGLGDRVGQCGDEHVGNQGQTRTGGDRTLGGDEKTRTNGTTEGNHGNVSCLQASLDLILVLFGDDVFEGLGAVDEVVGVFDMAFFQANGSFCVGVHGGEIE